MHGSLPELGKFNEWLSQQPAKHKLVVPGNHDFIVEDLPLLCRDTLTAGQLLIDEGVEIEGIKIYGSPWVPQYGRWAFMGSQEELRPRWERIPDSLDILITHGPPKNILDKTRHGDFAGCPSLRERLKIVRPKVHLFGHIHEGYGEAKVFDPELQGIRFINASTCDVHYVPNQKPIEIEL